MNLGAFLDWASPRAGLRRAGYRKVANTVRKRLRRRLRALGLPDLAAYRGYLERHPEEWEVLQSICRIPISRFCRDRPVFDALGERLLPAYAAAARAAGRREVRVWSAGCASGEEPYSVALVWHHAMAERFPHVSLQVAATDADDGMLSRAQQACYPFGSLKELPASWRAGAFVRQDELYCLKAEYRRNIAFRRSDLRDASPDGPFDLILCRNVAFTYFDHAGQAAALSRLSAALRPGGVLVVGKDERPPLNGQLLAEDVRLGFYRKSMG